jgi:predicted nucleic acid-binding Zn ribbon protein
MPSMKVCISCGRGIPMDASPSRCADCLPAWRERRRQQNNQYKTRQAVKREAGRRQASEAAGRKAPS